jgi:hypothetical protein
MICLSTKEGEVSIGRGLIALISLGPTLAGCIPSQPPPAISPAAAYTYRAPPQPQPRRAHNLPVPKSEAAKTTPDDRSSKSTIDEPIAVLPSPAEPSSISPGLGWGDTKEQRAFAPTTELIGLDETRATELLGPAKATESRAPGTVWHYQSSRCALDLVFYMEMRSGQMQTLHYDFKGEAGTAQQRQACLKTISDENSKNAATEW